MANPYAFAGLATFQIINGLQQAELIRETGEISRKVNDLNAQFAEQDIFEAQKFGIGKADKYQNVVNSKLNEFEAKLAYEGIEGASGTTLAQLKAESVANGIINQQEIRNQAMANVYGLKMNLLSSRTQAVIGQANTNLRANATQNAAILNTAAAGVDYYTRK